jgi:hypothetical protein
MIICHHTSFANAMVNSHPMNQIGPTTPPAVAGLTVDLPSDAIASSLSLVVAV